MDEVEEHQIATWRGCQSCVANTYTLSLNKNMPLHLQQEVSDYNNCRAMLCNRGLCRHAVSVRLSVCLSRSYILIKRLIVS